MKKSLSLLAIALLSLSTSFANDVESREDKSSVAECTTTFEAAASQTDVSADTKEDKSCCGTCQGNAARNENSSEAAE